MSDRTSQIVIADRDMLVRIWLTEAVAPGRMTQATADRHWQGYADNWHTLASYFSATDDAMPIRKLVRETGIRGRCHFKSCNGNVIDLIRDAANAANAERKRQIGDIFRKVLPRDPTLR